MKTPAHAITTKLIDMMDNSEIDPRQVADAALSWLSELSELSVAAMAEEYQLIPEEDDDDEEEEEYEYDGQPDEAQEWHDFDPDC